jgi:cation diffusion facilitator family transporter
MVHNLVDLLTAIGVLVGLKLSTRKTRDFPYGLYKLENVITVILALMTFVTAYEIARNALLGAVTDAHVNVWMLGGTIVATAIPLIFSRFELQAGREANSPALIADAREYQAHVFTTGVVFAALLAQWLNVPLDRIAALLIVIAISKTGWELLSDGMRVLLDASLEPDTLLQIRELMLAEPAVVELQWITGRNAGRYRFVEANVTLRVDDLEKAEAVTQRIEAHIQEQVAHIERVLIHAEPTQRPLLTYALPLADRDGHLDQHFGEAPYYALVKINRETQAIEEQNVIANPFLSVEKAKGIKVAEWLVDHKIDVVIVKESLQGKGPVYVFNDAGVTMHPSDAATLSTTLDEIKTAIA